MYGTANFDEHSSIMLWSGSLVQCKPATYDAGGHERWTITQAVKQ